MNAYLVFAVVAGIAVTVGVLYLYVTKVRGQVQAVADTMDKPAIVDEAEGALARLDAKLLGWKTIILAWVAGASQLGALVLPELLPAVQTTAWGPLVGEKAANLVTIICALLIPVVHAQGMLKAARTTPVDQG